MRESPSFNRDLQWGCDEANAARLTHDATPLHRRPHHVSRPSGRPQARQLIQRQARALGDPTRYDIFRYIADALEPVRVATLADHFGLNPNAIRQHLSKLTEALLLSEELATVPTGGRPPLQYRITPAAVGGWGTPAPHEMLSLALLRVLEGGAPVDAGIEEGLRMATSYPPSEDPLVALETEMARRGFEPRLDTSAGVVELVFDRCPFLAAASAAPDIVCEIHRGLAQGILRGLDADARVSRLVSFPPVQAGCRLQIELRAPEG
jgi:predicted ArsR family transcriptional regulator